MDLAPLATPRATQAAPRAETGSGTKITSDFQTFLKLLTAQIQNQDPLSPTPSDEFAVQLATFSGVEQQVRTNELLAALGGSGMGQFASWVGMEARAPAPAIFSGAPIALSPKPAPGADRTQLVVRDGSGREVERLDVPVSSGPIEWAGHDANGAPYLPGAYSFELVSFREGMPIASNTVETYSRILEARSENGETLLVLESGAKVAASAVTALREAV
jgi:flagellar basal-body rod modification protein FlgD